MWFKCSKWPARAKWNIIGYSQMSSSQIFLLCLLVLSLLLILIRARLELPHLRIINSLFCLVPLVLKFHKQLELSHCRKLNKLRKLWIMLEAKNGYQGKLKLFWLNLEISIFQFFGEEWLVMVLLFPWPGRLISELTKSMSTYKKVGLEIIELLMKSI